MRPGRIVWMAVRHLVAGKDGRGISRHIGGAAAGIVLALTLLFIVLELSDGMIEGITRRYIEVGTAHLQVIAFDAAEREEFLALAERLETSEDVRAVLPEWQGAGLLYSARGRSGATVRAVAPDRYEVDPGFRQYAVMQEGTFDLSDGHSVVLGARIAGELDVRVGDRVRLLTPRTVTSSRFIPRVTNLTVTGILATGYRELDALWIFIPLETGMEVFPNRGIRQIIGLKVDDPFAPDLYQTVDRINMELPGGWNTYTWYELEIALYKSFQTTKTLLLMIMVLIVIVAVVNVSSALIMLGLEKRPEIAILKAMGASPRTVMSVYVTTGLVIGLGSSFLGLVTGLLAAVNINTLIRGLEGAVGFFVRIFRVAVNLPVGDAFRILDPEYYLEVIPVTIDPWEIAGLVLLTLIASAVASYFPARRAARIRPLDVLRKHQ